jgi:hypothetical protein
MPIREDNGSRIYQIIIQSMHVLPEVNTREEPSTPTTGKGKRKATEPHPDDSPTKKAGIARDDDVFMK